MGSGSCSCQGGLCGSNYFVQNLTEHLNNTGSSFQGAIILETVLNYNDTPNSQIIPSGFRVGFPKQYHQLSQNQFRGDFLAVIGRAQDDAHLVSGITNAFKKNGKFKFVTWQEEGQGKRRWRSQTDKFVLGLQDENGKIEGLGGIVARKWRCALCPWCMCMYVWMRHWPLTIGAFPDQCKQIVINIT